MNKHGPLSQLAYSRERILKEVSKNTLHDIVERSQSRSGRSIDSVLEENLFLERTRLKQERPNWFTQRRYIKDKGLWSGIQSSLLKPSAEVNRNELLVKAIDHYAEEIGCRFSDSVYDFATRAVPFGFNWLLNAASLKKFLPWKMTESLQSRIQVLGEIEHLKTLSKKGTILLVPTHQSNIDSVLIGYVIQQMGLPPFSYGAGLNLFMNPLLNFFMGNLGAYTVDRKKSSETYKLVLKNYSTTILKEGIHSIFFPGGGRCRSGAIESKLKLGLLGTALDAQLKNYLQGKENPQVFIVPMVTSYHFVLEASSLIEDYLADTGKHRFIITDDESWQIKKVASFFWKFFASQSGITVRIGKPLDVFGNFVDENGVSQGPNGTTIDPKNWLTSKGILGSVPQRDQEYTRELGRKVVDRYYKDNTVLTSHLVAFSFFEYLREHYHELEFYRFLRISREQRTVALQNFLPYIEKMHARLIDLEKAQKLYLSTELKNLDLTSWMKDGVRNLGLFHEHRVVAVSHGEIWTEDMNLLLYYRNRLTGYGLET